MTTLNPTQAAILKRFDRNPDAAAISDALGVSLSYVYATLRAHRPNRARKTHPKRSDEPRIIVGMFDRGHKPARIAVSRGLSRAYIYRVLGDHGRL
ncbi:hypothetical protein [Bradyrhizobium liaoningense]